MSVHGGQLKIMVRKRKAPTMEKRERTGKSKEKLGNLDPPLLARGMQAPLHMTCSLVHSTVMLGNLLFFAGELLPSCVPFPFGADPLFLPACLPFGAAPFFLLFSWLRCLS